MGIFDRLFGRKDDVSQPVSQPQPDLDPHHMPAIAQQYFEEGERLSLDGDYWQAIDRYDRALRLAPNNADLWWRKGQCLAQCRQSEATECWEQAGRLDPYYKTLLEELREKHA